MYHVFCCLLLYCITTVFSFFFQEVCMTLLLDNSFPVFWVVLFLKYFWSVTCHNALLFSARTSVHFYLEVHCLCCTYHVCVVLHINPYHAKGYSRLVPNHTKRDYSRDWSKCSTMPSATIVLWWVFGSKIDSRRCFPLFIFLYIFLRWGHSFLVYIVPILCYTAKKMKTTKLSW